MIIKAQKVPKFHPLPLFQQLGVLQDLYECLRTPSFSSSFPTGDPGSSTHTISGNPTHVPVCLTSPQQLLRSYSHISPESSKRSEKKGDSGFNGLWMSGMSHRAPKGLLWRS